MYGMNRISLYAFLCIILGIFIFLYITQKNTFLLSQASQQLPSPTGILHAGMYPNPTYTPGNIIQGITSSQICLPGYSKTTRNVSVSTKQLVYQDYGVSYPQPKGSYEVDHFIPLELGGSNDISNLWPEPANPKPGFHEKDIVENYLHSQVCNSQESLEQAQKDITSNWYGIYQHIPNHDAYTIK